MTGISSNAQPTDQPPKGSTVIGTAQTTSTTTPITESFGRDLTRLAAEGKLDPVIGRDNEALAVAKIVGKKKKNNVILIGPAGAGKTAIIELLAQRIVNQTAPVTLLDKRIIELDIPLMHAGASMAGQLEKRMKSVLNELARDVNKNVVLFIDEVHLLTSGGGTGRIDLANIMKPAMARGELCLIAATTFDEYREHIETDKALKRRFEEVVVNEATVAETVTILQQVRGTYEKFHNVSYSDAVIDTIVDYANRFVTDRHFPDKALDIMDSLGALKKLDSGVSKNESTLRVELDAVAQKKREALRNAEYELAADLNSKQQELQYKVDNIKSLYQDIPRQEVTLDDVATIVSNRTGIPITKVSTTQADVINSLEENLRDSIIGQDDAIQTVVKAVRRSKAGLSNPDRPMGTLLFLGPTGVGKTEIVKQLAKNLFMSEKDIIKLDMSEYAERHTVSALVGSPAGYVGYGKGGGLTEKVRRKPHSIILLDEIEKAHPDVHKIFLQVFDEGKLTDRMGNEVNFKNTYIVMTSNAGVKKLNDFGAGIGFNTTQNKELQDYNRTEMLLKELKKEFPPEFLNRVDELVIFKSLTDENKKQILEINLHKFQTQMASLGSGGYVVSFTQAVKDFLTSISYDPDMGARPLNRAITKHIVDNVSTYLFESQPPVGCELVIDFNEKVVISHK